MLASIAFAVWAPVTLVGLPFACLTLAAETGIPAAALFLMIFYLTALAMTLALAAGLTLVAGLFAG